MSESDLWHCKHVTAGMDSYEMSVPFCKLSNMPCEAVLQYADEACKYERIKEDEDNNDRGYW